VKHPVQYVPNLLAPAIYLKLIILTPIKDHQFFFVKALPLEEVFDPNGAGGKVAGGFAGYLTQSENISFENMKNAIIYGSNLASFCVEKFGTERMVGLEKEEVVSRLKQFKSLTQFDIEI